MKIIQRGRWIALQSAGPDPQGRLPDPAADRSTRTGKHRAAYVAG